MANKIYPKYKQSILSGGTLVDLTANNVKVILVVISGGTIYSYSDAHQFLSDVPSGSITATSPNLTTKTVTALAAFTTDNVVFSAVSGSVSGALIMYIDTGTSTTSKLILYQDTGVTGLPITPNGSDIRVTVDSNGWFQL